MHVPYSKCHDACNMHVTLIACTCMFAKHAWCNYTVCM